MHCSDTLLLQGCCQGERDAQLRKHCTKKREKEAGISLIHNPGQFQFMG